MYAFLSLLYTLVLSFDQNSKQFYISTPSKRPSMTPSLPYVSQPPEPAANSLVPEENQKDSRNESDSLHSDESKEQKRNRPKQTLHIDLPQNLQKTLSIPPVSSPSPMIPITIIKAEPIMVDEESAAPAPSETKRVSMFTFDEEDSSSLRNDPTDLSVSELSDSQQLEESRKINSRQTLPATDYPSTASQLHPLTMISPISRYISMSLPNPMSIRSSLPFINSNNTIPAIPALSLTNNSKINQVMSIFTTLPSVFTKEEGLQPTEQSPSVDERSITPLVRSSTSEYRPVFTTKEQSAESQETSDSSNTLSNPASPSKEESSMSQMSTPPSKRKNKMDTPFEYKVPYVYPSNPPVNEDENIHEIIDTSVQELSFSDTEMNEEQPQQGIETQQLPSPDNEMNTEQPQQGIEAQQLPSPDNEMNTEQPQQEIEAQQLPSPDNEMNTEQPQQEQPKPLTMNVQLPFPDEVITNQETEQTVDTAPTPSAAPRSGIRPPSVYDRLPSSGYSSITFPPHHNSPSPSVMSIESSASANQRVSSRYVERYSAHSSQSLQSGLSTSSPPISGSFHPSFSQNNLSVGLNSNRRIESNTEPAIPHVPENHAPSYFSTSPRPFSMSNSSTMEDQGPLKTSNLSDPKEEYEERIALSPANKKPFSHSQPLPFQHTRPSSGMNRDGLTFSQESSNTVHEVDTEMNGLSTAQTPSIPYSLHIGDPSRRDQSLPPQTSTSTVIDPPYPTQRRPFSASFTRGHQTTSIIPGRSSYPVQHQNGVEHFPNSFIPESRPSMEHTPSYPIEASVSRIFIIQLLIFL